MNRTSIKSTVLRKQRCCFLTLPIRCLFLIGAVLSILTGVILANTDVRDSMVKIYAVQIQPNYDNPWNMKSPKEIYGSGSVISGNRILTNAHIVGNSSFIQVRLHGQSEKHTARVLTVSHETDLALLTIDDKSFFLNIMPLELGTLPKVQQDVIVYGFPEGGDTS